MKMSNTPKIPMEIVEPNSSTLDYKYTLVRERDGLTKSANVIKWIEWSEDGFYVNRHDEIELNRSLILDPHFMNYTWLTTTVDQIIENTDTKIVFKTKNSNYTLHIKK
jgi:hypothetical protein